MKKLTSLILLILLQLFIATPVGYRYAGAAAESYGRALNQNTYLYNSASTVSPCFLIPETYYVKILRDDGEFLFVQYLSDLAPYYKAISGYCKKTDLYLCDYIPDMPFLDCTLSVNNNTRGYASTALGAYDYLLNSGNPIIYYGKIRINNVLFYYVLAHGEYRCYVSASDCAPLDYQLNSDPLPTPEPDPGDINVVIPPIEPALPVKSDNTLKIVLVLVIAVPALIATAFLFRPQKTDKKAASSKYFYEEQEYE